MTAHPKFKLPPKLHIALGVSFTLIVLTLGISFFSSHNNKINKTYMANADKKAACSLLSLSVAHFYLGQVISEVDKKPTNSSGRDVKVTSCKYTQPGASKDNSSLIVKLVVQAPLTDRGTSVNKERFAGAPLANTKKVNVYGGPGYWDSAKGELNVLKNNNWYSITFGPTDPRSRNLSQTEELADSISNKL